MLVTAAARLDQRARRQERRAASTRGFARRRHIDALSAAAGAIAMVRPELALSYSVTVCTVIPTYQQCRLCLLVHRGFERV